ncbi:hypothetical protein [Martelella radicis]|uniref:Putative phosphosugar-binding protein n=1 Tax=Martelella radicis TaxID=1397476 RepID=A0A7W6KRC0_9HYPH|nr:hypothetical protein [Martelella radicis]MBB4124553.1 putative phosphosugar-binding protein [Martelella radicis]
MAASCLDTHPPFCDAFILDILVVIGTILLIARVGETPSAWHSAGMPGGDEANKAFEDKYIPQIRHLG